MIDKINKLADIFCYKKFSFEWLLYFIIELLLIVFFCISCYNADRLIKLGDEDTNIRNGLNVAIECVVIFIGIYLGFIWYRKDVSKLQLCFFGHISPFLILTGITALSATAKRIEKTEKAI